MSQLNFWRKCSFCKKEILLASDYYRCSVSSCNQRSTDFVFCSVHCFEAHVPGARHKDAAAVHEKSPPSVQQDQVSKQPDKISIRESHVRNTNPPPTGQRRLVPNQPAHSSNQRTTAPQEILIVASKLKDYIRKVADFNTSAEVMEALSDIVREECLKAIDRARADGRKTVMARDFK